MPLPPKKVESEEIYAEGDIDAKWRSLVVDDLDSLEGNWSLISEISESTDEILAALQIGTILRTVMKQIKPKVSITKIPPATAGGKPTLSIITHLPLGKTKSANVTLDGIPFSLEDEDTKTTWESTAAWKDGRLFQRRVSPMGVMYDVRCIFNVDPTGTTKESPILLFKWTFVDAKTQKNVHCHRFYKRSSK